MGCAVVACVRQLITCSSAAVAPRRRRGGLAPHVSHLVHAPCARTGPNNTGKVGRVGWAGVLGVPHVGPTPPGAVPAAAARPSACCRVQVSASTRPGHSKGLNFYLSICKRILAERGEVTLSALGLGG